MKWMRGHKSPGVTLIMVAAVLAILAALATGFYTLMLMQTKSATRYSDSVRAEMMCGAGIQAAIALLRQQAYEKTEDPTDPWYRVNYLDGARKRISFPADLSANLADDDGDKVNDNAEEKQMSFSGALGSSAGKDSDRFTLNISDSASRINVNAGDNLAVVLDNLCRVIGPPLIAADQGALQPRRWAVEGASAGLFDNASNANDTALNRNLYFWLYDTGGAVTWNGVNKFGDGRPKLRADGTAFYGDGYAIAGYRARYGRFKTVEDIKNALSYVERNGNDNPDDLLEQLEIEVKFAALREYITIDSWVDTQTVCVGKFEWVSDPNTSGLYDVAIDRDKSWVADDPVNDPKNLHGSLRGSYVSIMNGHGSGQLRRIKTNGVDWIQVEEGFVIPPGPISSYMIIALEDALLVDVDGSDLSYSYPAKPPPPGTLAFPKTFANGTLVDNPDIDYEQHPLCIHRAPVNINTASDKVLAALFLGLNIQPGHPLAVGTNADINKLILGSVPMYTWTLSAPNGSTMLKPLAAADMHRWKAQDMHGSADAIKALRLEPYLLTPKGLKRIPADSGRLLLDRPKPWPAADDAKFNYINNYGLLGAPNFDPGIVFESAAPGVVSEAHELAYRIIIARQRKIDPATGKPTTAADPDPTTADTETGFAGFEKGPFKSWDDLYFRVVKPWDDIRSYVLPDPSLPGRTTIPNSAGKTKGPGKASVAKMIMAHFNSNTDILKFNPNIEWIDRWGRNFTEMEAVMVFGSALNAGPVWTNQQADSQRPSGAQPGNYFIRSQRYKSDEMIDKTDLNRSTTEFSFDSGGIYEIESIGQIVKRGELLAERKLEALVKVYDVWRESTQAQFVQGTMSAAARSKKNTIGTATSSGYTDAGKIVRDRENSSTVFKALDTLPEPLVPLSYRIINPNSLADVVDPDPLGHDAFGRSKGASGSLATSQIPDILANKVLPARYDGQIVLATNTAAFNTDTASDSDSFLASFNGDLDTDTSLGNGREQAKTPRDLTKRVVDTIGLLGRLNDTEVDIDPGPNADMSGINYDVYINSTTQYQYMQGLPQFATAGAIDPVTGASDGRPAYWNNLSCRMGDLRAEGAYLGTMGTSIKDATVKYCFGTVLAPDLQNGTLDPLSSAKLANFEPGAANGHTLSMWFKPSWHATDNREHEFFDGGMLGNTSNAKYCQVYKSGRFSFSKPSGVQGGTGTSQFPRNNDLMLNTEGGGDDDFFTYVHGGNNRVSATYLPAAPPALPKATVLTPAYNVQPFRWAHVGAAWKYQSPPGVSSAPYRDGKYGYWGPNNQLAPSNDATAPRDPDTANHPLLRPWLTKIGRPFISSQRNPEGPDWSEKYYWMDVFSGPRPNDSTGLSGSSLRGQPAAYKDSAANAGAGWPSTPADTKRRTGVFSINNVNEARPIPPSTTAPAFSWIYRSTPLDGTYAIVDEFKLSKRMWTTDRIAAEETLSRYYLPAAPSDNAQCPAFTSQTMHQSLKGFNTPTPDMMVPPQEPQYITLVRVAWNVFTPRFMHEYKLQGTYTRKELVGHFVPSTGIIIPPALAPPPGTWQVAAADAVSTPFRGPFDYCQYNYAVGYDAEQGWKHSTINAFKPAFGVDRLPLPPTGTTQAHYSKGVEIELLDNYSPISGFHNASGALLASSVFVKPDAVNTFVDISKKPDQRVPIVVKAQNLRYRVRFRYPIDPNVDAGGTVNPDTQYLLDTPVFDDISITYFTKPRFLAYREVSE